MKGRLFVISKIIIIILRFPYLVSGNEYNSSYQCAAYGKYCDPYQHNSCCDRSFICKRRSNNFTCRQKVELGDYCKNNDDCLNITLATCSTDKRCICKPNAIQFDETKCSPLLGEFCRNNEQCLPNISVCTKNVCKCSKGFREHNNNQCIPNVLGSTCEDNADCLTIKFSECSKNKICTCVLNTISLSGIDCTPLLHVSCKDNSECRVNNSACIYNYCKCISNYVNNRYGECQPVLLGNTCTSNFDCDIFKNSKCSESNKCVCNDNSILINSVCVPILNGFCSNNEHCQSHGFYCVNNKCQCKPNFTLLSTSQCVETHLLFSCNNNLDCGEPWHTKCSEDKKCVCTSNNIALNRSTCYPTLRGRCWYNHQCVAKNSLCVDFQCKCQTNFFAISNNLCVSNY